MNDEEVNQAIRDYLAGVLHMSLATSRDSRPWVCEVHFVYDGNLNIYFRSKKSRRHSQEIAANPCVAGNIVEQHPKEQRPRGVYFEGSAAIVEDFDERHPAYKGFLERVGTGPEIVEDSKTADGHKIYKIVATDFYLFDARESSPSQKYHLPWKPAGNA